MSADERKVRKLQQCFPRVVIGAFPAARQEGDRHQLVVGLSPVRLRRSGVREQRSQVLRRPVVLAQLADQPDVPELR